ncbi:MAG TPA: copper amine oxidase [Parabacteroides merdae]|mgnify:FL=1|nr:copper amine oxidase [Parabacteroides merdae]
MAQEKDRKKPKRTPRSKGTATEEKPYVEQFSELLMVHNKNDPKAGLGVVSQVDEKGNYRTVPPDRKHENSFLKFDRNSSILENFIRNFWRQFKEPTHFRLLRMTYNDYKRNRQALDDLAKGKQTDAVKEFLKHYEIRPRKQEEQQNTNEKENESMAKKQQPQPEQQQQPQQQPEQLTQVEQAAQGMEGQPAGEQQSPFYRYNENMIDWEALGKVGISKEMLEQSGALDGMLRGYKTNKTIPLTLNIDGVLTAKLDARLSFISNEGQVVLGVHGIRKEPELSRPYFGHNFTEEEKKSLRETGNLGHPVDLNLRGGDYEKCLVSIDRNTNELVAVRQEHVFIPNIVKGVTLDPDEIEKLKNGEPIFVDGMTSAKGKEFSATLQYSAERRGIEFIFPKDQGFNQQTLGGVQLSPNQLKMLTEGHTILVEDMKRTNGELFSAFVTLDSVTGKPTYTRSNPETGEIYIPKEICQTPLTPEDRETLRKGGTVYLENMINRQGQEFSSFVRLNMTTGYPQYSRTPDGFNEQQVPKIPAEVYGHVFTAQEKADLQDGKAILVSGLKGRGGQEFSTYMKVSPNTGALNFFQENPDRPRNTRQQAAQAETQQQEQKKGAKQAV